MQPWPAYMRDVKTNKSAEELFAEIAEAGWLINNLFQIHTGAWRCNLRFELEDRNGVRTYFHEFADARTKEEALAAAIWNMRQKRNDATKGTVARYDFNKSIRLAFSRNAVARQQLDFYLEGATWLK